MKTLFHTFALFLGLTFVGKPALSQKIFDVHLHGSNDNSFTKAGATEKSYKLV
jgi:hypothetical protein